MFQSLSSATVVIGALRVNHLDKQTSCVFQEQYMLIHDVIAEFLLTQGDTEVRDYDIGKCITTLTHQIDGEPTPLDIQYSVRFHIYAMTGDFQQCGMCDWQRLRPAV